MELNEMKSLWEEMDKKIGQQQLMTDKLILEMTQERYSNKLRGISTTETLGAIICFAMALYIMIHFKQLDTWYIQLSGSITVIACIVLPILSLKSIKKMKTVHIAKNTFKQSLLDYTKGETRFMLVQKVSFYLSFLLLTTSLITFAKIMKGIDVFTLTEKLNWMVPSGIGALYIFILWVHRKYKKATASLRSLLSELEH